MYKEMLKSTLIPHGPVRIRTALSNDYLIPIRNILAQTGDVILYQVNGIVWIRSKQGNPGNGTIP